MSNNIGLKLKEIRLKKNLTLKQASKSSGISETSIGQIERSLKDPKISTVSKILLAYGRKSLTIKL